MYIQSFIPRGQYPAQWRNCRTHEAVTSYLHQQITQCVNSADEQTREISTVNYLLCNAITSLTSRRLCANACRSIRWSCKINNDPLRFYNSLNNTNSMQAIPLHSFNSHDIIRREIANQLLVSLWPEAALKCVLAATPFIIRRELFCLLSIRMCTICCIDLFAFHFAFYFNEDNWSLLFFLAQAEINQLSPYNTHGTHCSLLRGT